MISLFSSNPRNSKIVYIYIYSHEAQFRRDWADPRLIVCKTGVGLCYTVTLLGCLRADRGERMENAASFPSH